MQQGVTVDGGQEQGNAVGGGAQRAPTVNPSTWDFWPWMIAQSRKPRRNVNHTLKSRVPSNSGKGDNAGSRFAALAEEGEDLNLETGTSMGRESRMLRLGPKGFIRIVVHLLGLKLGGLIRPRSKQGELIMLGRVMLLRRQWTLIEQRVVERVLLIDLLRIKALPELLG